MGRRPGPLVSARRSQQSRGGGRRAPRDLVAADHLVHFVRDVVLDELDLSEVYAHYEELRGYPPDHPAMMTAQLLYGTCRGIDSSRRIERACEERVDFMARRTRRAGS